MQMLCGVAAYGMYRNIPETVPKAYSSLEDDDDHVNDKLECQKEGKHQEEDQVEQERQEEQAERNGEDAIPFVGHVAVMDSEDVVHDSNLEGHGQEVGLGVLGRQVA